MQRMEVKEKFAMGNTRNALQTDPPKLICKGVFHVQGWNDDHSANLGNFFSSLFMSQPSSSVVLGRVLNLENSETSENQFSEVFHSEFFIWHYTQN